MLDTEANRELSGSGGIDEWGQRNDYTSDNPRQAAPEGGILSMRFSRFKSWLSSADEHLTSEEARRLLLEPVFFPSGGEALTS